MYTYLFFSAPQRAMSGILEELLEIEEEEDEDTVLQIITLVIEEKTSVVGAPLIEEVATTWYL